MRGILKITILLSLLAMFSPWVYAWNLGAMTINALIFDRDGSIRFTLFKPGGGGEYQCKPTGSGRQWFYVQRCSSADQNCTAAVSRMASMLVAAKLSRKAVHVQNNNCQVTQVALKPM